MEKKVFIGVTETFFERLQTETASGLDPVEDRLFFHDVEFSFSWDSDSKELTLKLVSLPSTFSAEIDRAWELISEFITTVCCTSSAKKNGVRNHA